MSFGNNVEEFSHSIRAGNKSSLGFSKTYLKPEEMSGMARPDLSDDSEPLAIPSLDPFLERSRQKMVRAEGEDLIRIHEVISNLSTDLVTVQEFVGLISPHTEDYGDVLRTVMGEDLLSFRKMAKRVYDAMTQDISDVFTNEQINLTDSYNEKYSMYMKNMGHVIDEIYQYVPNFDFELYYQDPTEYLKKLFPVDDEDEEDHSQEMYHRLQWLRLEGARLKEENSQLNNYLSELKRIQEEELIEVIKREKMSELRRTHLEATQMELQNQLNELDSSVEESFELAKNKFRISEDKPTKRLDLSAKLTSEPLTLKTRVTNSEEEFMEKQIHKIGNKMKKVIQPQVKLKNHSDTVGCSDSFCKSQQKREVSASNYLLKGSSSSQSPKRLDVRNRSPVIELPIERNPNITEQAFQFRSSGLINKFSRKDMSDRSKTIRWMKKLATCNQTINEMKLRNDFMYYLVLNVQNGKLQTPFTENPPLGPLSAVTHLLAGTNKILNKGLGTSGTLTDAAVMKEKPLLYENSPDGGAFLAAQPIPRCGAFCYLAVVSRSK